MFEKMTYKACHHWSWLQICGKHWADSLDSLLFQRLHVTRTPVGELTMGSSSCQTYLQHGVIKRDRIHLCVPLFTNLMEVTRYWQQYQSMCKKLNWLKYVKWVIGESAEDYDSHSAGLCELFTSFNMAIKWHCCTKQNCRLEDLWKHWLTALGVIWTCETQVCSHLSLRKQKLGI